MALRRCVGFWISLDSVLAVALRLVEGCVGGREELRGSRGGRRRGDAEARGDGYGRPVGRQDDPAGECEADPLGHLRAAREIRAREDEQELLPAPAAGEVDVAQG